jgi:prepilin-type N-terminal cleavage/methylation domain-containing protein
MDVLPRPRRVLWGDQRGFTLVEVMVTILIMGIVFAIATITYQRVVEARQVDAATNQLVSDLRLAHSKATNRLSTQTVTLSDNSSEYTVTGAASPRDLDDSDTNLVVVDTVDPAVTTLTITFEADGSATVAPDGISTVQVEAAGNSSYCHAVDFNDVTSRVTISDPCS